MERKYISLQEFCARYNVSKSKAYELAKTVCPPVHVGGRPLKPLQFDPEVTDKVFYTPTPRNTESRSLTTEKRERTERPLPKKEKVCL